MGRINDLTGKTFGSLTVLYSNGRNKNHKVIWRVECICGNTLDVLGNSLVSGNTKSCGCLQKSKAKESIKKLHSKQWSDERFVNFKKQDMKERFTVHGARCRTNPNHLYTIWRGMICRCKFTSSYIEKGIVVCKEWLESFPTFQEWAINNGYEKGKHLDRVDNKGNYEPGNCQFLTQSEHSKKTGEEMKKFYAERRVLNG